MRQHGKLNALLMEILIAVLFFALCSCVILNLISAASNQSIGAGQVTKLLSETQSLADSLYVSEDRAATLLEAGFTAGEDGYVREDVMGTIHVVLHTEEAAIGSLNLADIHAITPSGKNIELTSTRYVPEEVQP